MGSHLKTLSFRVVPYQFEKYVLLPATVIGSDRACPSLEDLGTSNEMSG